MEHPREHWGSRVGFLMAAMGSAIGLGILWKFPYTVGQNGGGLFLITYFLCVIFLGIPLFIAEILLGKKSQKGAVMAFQFIAPTSGGWKIGAYLGVLASFLIMSYYSVIAGWGMNYILMSLSGFYNGLKEDQIGNAFNLLSHSASISLFWHFLFTAITMSVVFTGVRKGIEYWSKIMVKILLGLLIVLLLFSLSLDGLKEACHFIFYPDLRAFKLSSILEALGLAFFTLSLGQGIMISYGSYVEAKEDIVKMAFIVGFSVIVVAIMAALMIFPVVFTFGLKPDSGFGLVFQTLPYLFAKLPASMLISTLFFSLFVFTALTSAFPLIEVVAANIMELFQVSRQKAVVGTALTTAVFGIPSAVAASGAIFPEWEAIFQSNFLVTMDSLVSVWIIPIAGLITSIFIGWRMDTKTKKGEFIQTPLNIKIFPIWNFFLKWVIPVVMIVIIIQKSGLFDFDRLLGGAF
jgi:NSS family neurotransmitter:Na+ symporter